MRELVFLLIVFSLSCKEGEFIPKPRMYPRVDYPNKDVKKHAPSFCDFSFEFPSYGIVKRDSLFFDERSSHPCWFDLNIESLNAQIHCSYAPITKEKPLDKLIYDAFNLAGEHNTKATFRRESLIENEEDRVFGLLFNIEGPVATPIQFYLTDSTSNFFRASLYFNAKVDPDSTKAVVDFINPDIQNMIESFKWSTHLE